ncbi:MAG: gamma-glutamyltransferase family protein [Hyphomonadaceae bacterium]
MLSLNPYPMLFKLLAAKRRANPALRRALALLLPLALIACATASAPLRRAGIVTAANPHAVAAGVEMLNRGGTATDAAIAAMAVLGLVEPQSAGLGGGGFLMHFDASNGAIDAFDGRETAPMGATPDMFLDAEGRPLPFLAAKTSGRAIGAPSLIAMLHMAHEAHGRLPWARLFEPAIRLADEGFAVSPRLHNIIAAYGARARLAESPDARAYLYTPDGAPLPVGHILRNPAYAESLRAIAARGPDALRDGPLAEAIVAAARREPLAGALSLSDLQSYRARRLDPVCGAFRVYRVCSMPPPSSGGVAVIETLGLFERARPNAEGVQSPEDWAAYLWAARLAYVDRDYYVGDDAFVPVPTEGLIDARYLDDRARQIDLSHAPRNLAPGDPSRFVGGASLLERWGRETAIEAPGTTHLSIMDGHGNVVAMTATIEGAFGAHRMAGGFFLNNQMTDFSFRPALNGRPVANAVAPGKRPRSSMAPVLMFEADGDFYAAIGSPGGGAIISYVARTIIGFTDWGLTMQEAIDLPHLVASAPIIRAEQGVNDELTGALTARGWRFESGASEESGLHGFRMTTDDLDAGADRRREGSVRRAN